MDIFDGRSGRWSTAILTVARQYLAATSLPSQGLALFAGGNASMRFLAATCMLPLADAFAQMVVIAELWIFSMGAVDVGALLFSA